MAGGSPAAASPTRRRESQLVGPDLDHAAARAAVPDHVCDALADGPREDLAPTGSARRRQPSAVRVDAGCLSA